MLQILLECLAGKDECLVALDGYIDAVTLTVVVASSWLVVFVWVQTFVVSSPILLIWCHSSRVTDEIEVIHPIVECDFELSSVQTF